MNKFGYLEATKPKADITKDYEISGIEINGVSPVLTVKPAHKSNKKYWAEIVRMAQSRGNKKKKLTSDDLEEATERDIELYAKYVIVDWKHVLDDSGKVVPCNKQDVIDFLHAIPEHEFDDLRLYCGEITNFVDSVDVETIAKN